MSNFFQSKRSSSSSNVGRISSCFYDKDMRLTVSAFLKQNLAPFMQNSEFVESAYYPVCSISPDQLPDKPYNMERGFRQWTEAKAILSNLSKLEVQHYNVKRTELVRFMYQCLRKVQVNKEDARTLIDALVDQDTRKEFGQGLFRLELYIADILDESIDPMARPRPYKENACTAWVNGNNSLGPIVGKYCMNMAIEKAEENGVGMVVVNCSNYMGKCSYYSRMASDKGVLGMTFSNSPHVMAPTRAKHSFLGWNPMSLAAPSTVKDNNVIIDINTTEVTIRRIITCASKGKELPYNCALDKDGHHTTDPKEVLQHGCLLPLGGIEETGGYKGYGLSILVEILCGIMSSSDFGKGLKRIKERDQNPVNMGHCFIVVNPKMFAPNFKKRQNDMARVLRTVKPVKSDSEEALTPSENDGFLQSHIVTVSKLRYRLVELMAAYQLSCILRVPPLRLKPQSKGTDRSGAVKPGESSRSARHKPVVETEIIEDISSVSAHQTANLESAYSSFKETSDDEAGCSSKKRKSFKKRLSVANDSEEGASTSHKIRPEDPAQEKTRVLAPYSRMFKLYPPFAHLLSPLDVSRVVPVPDAKRFMTECLEKVGVESAHAMTVSDVLVNGDHFKNYASGLLNLLKYIHYIQKNTCKINGYPKILKETRCTAWVNGNNALGPVIGNFCMMLAIKKAMRDSIGIVVVNNSNYIGDPAWYTHKALSEGMIGLTFTNSPPEMCPTRAKRAALGGNPLSIGASGENEYYLCSMTNLATSMGKLVIYSREMEAIPENWALDEDGNVTVDAETAAEAQLLLPLGGVEKMGGYKGYGMAIMVEVLCGILGDSLFGPHIPKMDDLHCKLKAFYVDLLVPLETNLEKDTKVVQSEQKKFLQQHKQRSETYSKAAATMKKQRKKNKGTTKTGLAMDKELKHMQVLEEEKSKLDAFCEQSLKTAMTQERRRYGFVLERQCSLAKHYLAYHTQGSTVLQRHLDDWNDVAQTREFLPDSVEAMFTNRLRQVSFWPDEDLYSNPRSPNVEDDRLSIASQLRKTKSMDASCLDMRSINDATSPMKPLSRAKSDFNLTASTHSLVQDQDTPTRPKSMAVPDRGPGWDTQLARALYAYLSSGDNQLSFLEGDIIALMGERNKGWQFGENLRTQCSGWFPLAYTELILDDTGSPTHQRMQSLDSTGSSTTATTPATPTTAGFGISSPSAQQQQSNLLSGKSGVPSSESAPRPSAAAPVTMFGDTLLHHRASATAKQMRRGTTVSASNVGPPPTLPAPVPTPKVPASSTLPVARGVADRRLIHPPPMPPLPMLANVKRGGPGVIGSGIGNASLHSSNDSGFSNDPPPAPEVDYSDDDSARKPRNRKQAKQSNATTTADSRSSATPNKLVEKRKKQLLSSVRGWLLYKSALDLWDDVNCQPVVNGQIVNGHNNAQQMNSLPNNKTPSPSSRPPRPPLRQSSSVGHLATLGRYNGDKTSQERQNSMTLPTGAQRPAQIKSMEVLSEKKSYMMSGAAGGPMVKRSKSLWKFKRFNKDDEGILEGMSLWQHRSLVDVHVAVQQEDSQATTPVVKKKSTATNTSLPMEEKKPSEKSPTPLLRTKLVPMNEDENVLNGHSNGHAEMPPKPMERKSVKQNGNGISPNSPPPPPNKPAPRSPIDMNDDDGLMIMRSNQQAYCSSEDELEDEVDGEEEENSDLENGDSESCIVVDDHMKAKITLSRRQQILRETSRTPLDNAPRLPRTRLLKSHSRKNTREEVEEVEPLPADGLLYYGRTLQYRLKKPERGSRFDQVSQTTGNMYGPWYDLWGIDPSVRQ